MNSNWIKTATAALIATLLLALAGCGKEQTGTPLTIAIQSPAKGPLAKRAQDMGRAAQLELDAIKSNAAGHPLKLVIGPYQDAIAGIDLLSGGPQQVRGQLLILMSPPLKREVRSPGPSITTQAPRIWIVPPQETAKTVTREYAASGAPGAKGAITDSPLRPGTPSSRYVTAALSEHNYPPAGSAFYRKFEEKFGRAPDRWAIYAYEAVGLIVDAINKLEQDGKAVTQAAVANQALNIKNRFGPVGHYDILPSGQSTLYTFQVRGPGAPEGSAALLEAQR